MIAAGNTHASLEHRWRGIKTLQTPPQLLGVRELQPMMTRLASEGDRVLDGH